jgi:hypothetical protein
LFIDWKPVGQEIVRRRKRPKPRTRELHMAYGEASGASVTHEAYARSAPATAAANNKTAVSTSRDLTQQSLTRHPAVCCGIRVPGC